MLMKKAKGLAKSVESVDQAGVLGAGIMGGGIAYQSAYKGVPIIMKDIAQSGIDLGLKEATSLLTKRVDRGRMNVTSMAETLARIHPQLDYSNMQGLDIVVEAVVENPNVKKVIFCPLFEKSS